MRACRRLESPAALERSRSGHGGHVWLFFDEALPAALARRLGSYLLTEAMERRPDIGLDSYDRFFPNQDTLPQGGFGNLIALPLQKQRTRAGQQRVPRRRLRSHGPISGRSLRVRADRPSAGRRPRAGRRAPGTDSRRSAAARGRRCRTVDGAVLRDGARTAARWRVARPVSSWSSATRSTSPRRDSVPGLRNRLLRLAAFQNPEFYKAQAMRLSTYDKPRVIACAEDHSHHIALPRGCLDDVEQTLNDLGIRPTIRDERCSGQSADVTFRR